MLYNGEEVGDGTGPECDVAVDPIDGTTLTAKGMTNAIVGARGRAARLDVRPVRGVLHGEAGHRAGGRRRRRHHATRSPRTSAAVAKAKGSPPEDVTVVHPRPAAARGAGRRDPRRPAPGSSSSPTATSPARSWPPAPDTGIDLLLGIGGTPEGIIAACAMKCLGGVIQGRLWPQRRRRSGSGRSTPATTSTRVLTTDDLVTGDDCFFVATGHHRRRADAGRALPRRRRDARTRW